MDILEKVLLISLVSFLVSVSHADELYLLQSTGNVDQALVIPRDIKRPLLVISLSADCVPCLRRLGTLAREVLGASEFDVAITLDSKNWRRAHAQFAQNPRILRKWPMNLYYDPAGRLRRSLTSESETVVALYNSNGQRILKETLTSPLRKSVLLKVLGSK